MLRRALEEPMRHIGTNAGVEGSVMVEAIRRKAAESKNRNIGYNVLTNEYTDMVKAGIIDPAKVTRSALENAASIAGMILTTEALVTEIPETSAPAAPMRGGAPPRFSSYPLSVEPAPKHLCRSNASRATIRIGPPRPSLARASRPRQLRQTAARRPRSGALLPQATLRRTRGRRRQRSTRRQCGSLGRPYLVFGADTSLAFGDHARDWCCHVSTYQDLNSCRCAVASLDSSLDLGVARRPKPVDRHLLG
jgi:hypothetical protein